jgi:hypothetical protein
MPKGDLLYIQRIGGGCMDKPLLMVMAALLCWGCGRATGSGPDEVVSSGTVVTGFGNEPRVLTSSQVVRVGSYYDFSMYDSLRISFSAARLSTDLPFDVVLVKIGPATYLRDTVYSAEKNVSLSVKVSQISKPGFCALTFWTFDPLTVLKLYNLHVEAWVK